MIIPIHEAFRYLVNKGYKPHHVAGILGNIMQESSGKTDIVNPSSGAYGLAQWLGDRKRGLHEFAKSRNQTPDDWQTQIDYIDHELKTKESRALQKLLGTQNERQAASVFSDAYERAGQNEKNNANRESWATRFFKSIIPDANADEFPPEVKRKLDSFYAKHAGNVTPGNYGNRPDGTPKGRGFYGELKRPDGRVMTEYSVGMDFDGHGNIDVPTIVPGLTKQEIDTLLKLNPGEKIPQSIIDKAGKFARARLDAGLPVFASKDEEGKTPMPMDDKQTMDIPEDHKRLLDRFHEKMFGKQQGVIMPNALIPEDKLNNERAIKQDIVKPVANQNEIYEGAARELRRQKSGLGQLLGYGKDAYELITGDPEHDRKSAERQAYYNAESQALKDENQKSKGDQWIGEMIPSILEFAAVPTPSGFMARMGSNAGLGALYSQLKPYSEDESRLAQGTVAAGLGAVLPEVAGGVASFGARRFGGMINKDQAAINEIERNIGYDYKGATPKIPDNWQSRYPYIEGIQPTAAMLSNDPAIWNMEKLSAVKNPVEFMQRHNSNKQILMDGIQERALPQDNPWGASSEMRDAINQETSPIRESALNTIRQANPVKKKPVQPVEIDPQGDDIIMAIKKLGGINKESSQRIYGGKLWEDLPKVKFTNEGGQSLDDIAKNLHQRGYIENPDIRTLVNVLTDHEIGFLDNVYSKFKNDFSKEYDFIPKSQHEDLMASLTDLIGALNKKKDAINYSDIDYPNYAKGLADLFKKYGDTPGERVDTVLGKLIDRGNSIMKLAKDGKLDPADLYQYRKDLADVFNGNNKNMQDEFANAVKSKDRHAKQIMSEIDKGLDSESDGLWKQYLDEHSSKMRNIQDKEAFQSVLDELTHNGGLARGLSDELGNPIKLDTEDFLGNLTTNRLYNLFKKYDKETIRKSGEQHKFTDENRQFMSTAYKVLRDIDKSMGKYSSTVGSQTTPLAVGLFKSGLSGVLGNSKANAIYNVLETIGHGRESQALKEALLNPDEFNRLMDVWDSKRNMSAKTKGLKSIINKAAKGAAMSSAND